MSLVLRDKSAIGTISEIEVEEVYFSARTKYQDVLIGQTAFGRALFLDGNGQSSERDEGIYHSALVHPAMFTHPNPRRVLIGGGGEGATLREVLKHPEVESVVMVDIDAEAVAAFKEHLPGWSKGSFDDPRATVLHEDIRAWLERHAPDSFDVIILDLSDPILDGPSALTFTREFYALCDRVLAPGGILTGQTGEFDHGLTGNYWKLMQTIGDRFAHVRPYRVGIPFFACEWGFMLAAHQPIPASPPDHRARFERAGGSDWADYDPDGHRAWMWLSPRLKAQFAKNWRVLTDDANLAGS